MSDDSPTFSLKEKYKKNKTSAANPLDGMHKPEAADSPNSSKFNLMQELLNKRGKRKLANIPTKNTMTIVNSFEAGDGIMNFFKKGQDNLDLLKQNQFDTINNDPFAQRNINEPYLISPVKSARLAGKVSITQDR